MVIASSPLLFDGVYFDIELNIGYNQSKMLSTIQNYMQRRNIMKTPITKRTAALCATLLTLVILSAARGAETPYDVHVILELTGGGAFIGNSERQAMELAQKTINASGGVAGRGLHFVFHDNQSNPQVSVQLANEVLATHPAVVIGPTLLADCHAMAPLFRNRAVLICITPSFTPPQGSYLYSSDLSTRSDAIAGIRYLRLKGWKRIAVITSTDATGQDAEKNIAEIAKFPENKDVSIVANVHFNPTDVSVSAQIETIKTANPQALIAYTVGTPLATIFRGLRDAGLDIPVATSPGNEVYREMEQFADFLPKQLYFFTSSWPARGNTRVKLPPEVVAKQQEFFRVLEDAGLKPDQGSNEGWQPAMLVGSVLRKLGTAATAGQIQDYLQHLKGLAGVSGVYDFEETPQRGLSAKNALVSRWNSATKHWEAVSELGGTPMAK
jgi:branched-chain amino acid transport system substrate-binding protein